MYVTGTQTDKPALMSTGVSCHLLIEPKVTVDISSPAATATTYSSQAINSQNSDFSYQPTQSEESQSEERFDLFTVGVLYGTWYQLHRRRLRGGAGWDGPLKSLRRGT
jgi:hypothetical protein